MHALLFITATETQMHQVSNPDEYLKKLANQQEEPEEESKK